MGMQQEQSAYFDHPSCTVIIASNIAFQLEWHRKGRFELGLKRGIFFKFRFLFKKLHDLHPYPYKNCKHRNIFLKKDTKLRKIDAQLRKKEGVREKVITQIYRLQMSNLLGMAFARAFSLAFLPSLVFLEEWVSTTATNKSNPKKKNLTAITKKKKKNHESNVSSHIGSF